MNTTPAATVPLSDDKVASTTAPHSRAHTPIPAAPITIPKSSTSVSPDRRDRTRDRDDGERKRRPRRRATSDASSVSSQSGDSPATPPESGSPDEDGSSPVIATSPILSYFLAHASPTNSTAGFSFKNRRKIVGNPFQDDAVADDEEPVELPHVLHHSRRLSSSWANTGTIGIQQKGPITGSQQERGASIMRRLSLSGGIRPNLTSLSTQVTSQQPIPEVRAPTPRAPRRSMTVSNPVTHRPPSPMGERMLKGHFDGF